MTKEFEHKDIIVLGSGVIGVTTALSLLRSGHNVTLIDRKNPGLETSYGNAGVLNRGSIIPLNNPSLIKNLPSLLLGKQPGLKFNPFYMVSNFPWALKFLLNSTQSSSEKRVTALQSLILRSAELYIDLLKPSSSNLLKEGGWLKLYGDKAPNPNSFERQQYDKHNVRYDILGKSEIMELEPALKGNRAEALWIKDSNIISDPGKMVSTLARQFSTEGGNIIKANITEALKNNDNWVIKRDGQEDIKTDTLVIALGPWTKDWLKKININLPMAYERGGHREYQPGYITLQRSIYDVTGGYVLSPMENRWRLTCGVELNAFNALPNPAQLNAAEKEMNTIISVGETLKQDDWFGARPTLPDALPLIGELKQKGLWVATGHQHIGIASAPATAELLTDLINRVPTTIDSTPFKAERFGL